MDEARLISFDEAGFTGPNLLDKSQPYFIYASHDLTEDESLQIIGRLRNEFGISAEELKASQLKRRSYWKEIISIVCDSTNGRAKIIYNNKKVALTGKFFEYLFEPVLAHNSIVFYKVGFHKYIMNVLYDSLSSQIISDSDILKEMQLFMRNFDANSAPSIFEKSERNPLALDRIFQFCRGYREKIKSESMFLRSGESPTAKWTLDLTATCLHSLLFHEWGHRYKRLKLVCDQSKPLAAYADTFNQWVGNKESAFITDGKISVEIKGNLAEPVRFLSSKDSSTLQVADLLAGIALYYFSEIKPHSTEFRRWMKFNVVGRLCVDLDQEFRGSNTQSVRIGREILKELSERAARNDDPLAGMSSYIANVRRRFSR